MSKIFKNDNELSSVNGGLQDTIFLGKKELEILKEKGLLDNNGVVDKSELKRLEECLQSAGWNGIIIELHDEEKFDNLSDEILFKCD